ncbi:protein-cysteine N-palmitoyltransferase HHAT-like [Branchiostoma floridae]|uniref:Protein-cysteine N-palmitoyltransferase HHAT-like n=1 Tax=Branchiostoma floridae TaxID=7739 RepID=A0A9J7MDI3_BRAFL|nr:protein-cysteine N-palmitoyltransferase HHAT-like [Branchiostoma floridae]
MSGAQQADLRRRTADQSEAPPSGVFQPPVAPPGTAESTEPKPTEIPESRRTEPSASFVPLPKAEVGLCATISLCVIGYMLYCTYRFSEDHRKQLNVQDLAPGWTLLGRKKDIHDIEWREWTKRMRTAFPLYYLGHVMLGAVTGRLMPKAKFPLYGLYGLASLTLCLGMRPAGVVLFQAAKFPLYGLYGLASLTLCLGWRPAGVVLFQAAVFFLLSRLRRPALIWGFAIVAMTTVYMEPGNTWHYNLLTSYAKYNLYMVTLTLSCLRGVSFAMDLCRETEPNPASYSLLDLLNYNFYWPILTSGPIINYHSFRQQRLSQDEAGLQNLPMVLWGLARLMFWFLCVEVFLHYFYIHAICVRMDIVGKASVFTLYGLIYAQVQFFHVKYVVFFGLGSTLARLDGISAPPQPRCVATVYQFADMWRSFDPGLYKWLVRYIYWPLGGSRSGLLRQIAASIVTFVFVYYWHGASHNLFVWAALQFIGVLLETLTRRFMRLPAVKELEMKYLSAESSRRLRMFLNTGPFVALMISNT